MIFGEVGIRNDEIYTISSSVSRRAYVVNKVVEIYECI